MIQMQGNPVKNSETVTTGNTSAVAPKGAVYARVLVSVLSTVSANTLAQGPNSVNLGNGRTIVVPANGVIEIPNVIEGVTTVTVANV